VSEIARRWQVCPQQVFGWRRAARQDVTTAAATTTRSLAPGFGPIVREAAAPVTVPRAASAAPVIEVKLAGAVVRVVSGLEDGAQLTAVLRAVRASASRP
jgi:transposase